jgi:hypothetical protein
LVFGLKWLSFHDDEIQTNASTHMRAKDFNLEIAATGRIVDKSRKQLESSLHGRLAERLLPFFSGNLFAQGRRAAGSWSRAGGLRN